MRANEVVSDDRLIDELWGGDPPDSGGAALRVRVSQLRRALAEGAPSAQGPELARQAQGYVLRVDPQALDARRFERLLAEGTEALRNGAAEQAAPALESALALWRGPALAEFTEQPTVAAEAARLDELRLAAREETVAARLALGHHAELVGELEALIARDPLRERPRGQLMLALYRSGRQADALNAYREARRTLVDELGIEPSRALRELERGILGQEAALESPAPVWVQRPATGGAGAAPAARVRLPLARPLRSTATTPPLAGRRAKLGRLRELWEDPGGRRLVVVSGEAGIGKTRLAAELASTARDAGALVLHGHCDEGVAIPYQPFSEALRPYAAAIGAGELAAALGRLTPELARLLPELAERPGEARGGDAETQRYALFESIAATIELAARDQRVLLVVDDLHWAPAPTLLALRHLLRSDRAGGALVVGTCRDTELGASHPLTDLLADLQGDAGAATIDLGGLDADAVASLVAPAVRAVDDERASAVAATVLDGTGGNPFYIREVVAHLIESGAVGAAPLELPDGLRRVIGRRVDRLSDAARRALAVAAVAGPTCSLGLLESVLGDSHPAVDAVEELAAAGLLADAGGGAYGFVHALVRQTVYAEMGSARRQRLHRRAGEAIEASADPGAEVQALAHHFAQAAADGQAGKASAYALAAGATAIAKLGYDEAAAHYERGLDALERTGGGDREIRCELLLGLGEARWSTGEMDRARAAFVLAAELAEELGDHARFSRAALGYCGPPRFEPATELDPPVEELLERALAVPGGEGSERARLTGRLAAALTFPGPAERRDELARDALAMARRAGDRAALADVLATTYFATRGPDNLDRRLATVAELSRLADQLGDGRLAALAHYWRSLDLLESGRLDGVHRELATLGRLAQTLGQRYPQWLLAASRSRNTQLEGRLDAAEALAHEALEIGGEVGEAAVQVFGGQIVWLRREQGRLEEVLAGVEAFVERFPELGAWRCGLALFQLETGDEAAARAQLGALAADDFSGLQRDVLWTLGMTLLAEVAARLGDTERAATLYGLLAPHAGRCVVAESAVCLGSVARSLGVLATALSRFDEAAAHFEAALEANAAIGSPLWVARTQHDYALMLARRGASGDRARSRELAAGARAAADRLSLVALRRRLEAEAR